MNREAVLTAGLAWLYDTEQPDGVVHQHHGVISPEVDDRQYRFIPQGHNDLPVVVVDVAHPVYLPGDRVEDPLGGPAEVAEVVALLTEMGHQVAETWNGDEGTITASISLARPAHPSLLAAVKRYLDGCPTHNVEGGTFFCHQVHGCTWYADSAKPLVRPVWPSDHIAS